VELVQSDRIFSGAHDKKFLIEEQTLVDEAIYSSYPLHSIVMSQSFSQSQEFLDEALKFIQPKVPIYFIPDDLLKRIYPSGTLPRYIAVAYTHEQRYRNVKDLLSIKKSTPIALVENISSPSVIGKCHSQINFIIFITQLTISGTLLNVSDVFGVTGVVLINNEKQESATASQTYHQISLTATTKLKKLLSKNDN